MEVAMQQEDREYHVERARVELDLAYRADKPRLPMPICGSRPCT